MRTLPLILLVTAPVGLAQNGMPVPELAAFDQIMIDYMNTHSIDDGVLGVMRDGRIVYQRGFGTSENTLMRIASVEKPVTAAAIRKMIAWGWIELDDFVFDLGQPGGGILPHIAWQGVGSGWLDDVTVGDLLRHEGGWDRDVWGDPMFMNVQIAQEMGLPHPVGRDDIIRWMMSQPIQHQPGTTERYSNYGYMLLGRIIEEVAGPFYVNKIRAWVLTQGMWIPSTEVVHGRSKSPSQNPREPYYDSHGCTGQDVFDPTDTVQCPYGTWHHEAMVGHGNMVTGAAPLLRFLDRYVVIGDDIGLPHGGSPPNAAHTGGLRGTSTIASQSADGTHIVVLFPDDGGILADHAFAVATLVRDHIDANAITWPTQSVDGFWIDTSSASNGFGGFNDPFWSVSTALGYTTPGSRLNLKNGASPWTGVLAEKLLLSAPAGGKFVLGN